METQKGCLVKGTRSVCSGMYIECVFYTQSEMNLWYVLCPLLRALCFWNVSAEVEKGEILPQVSGDEMKKK